MAANNLAYIERMLRAGKTPEQLGGKVIGKGVCKAAYYFESPSGGFVVKLNAQRGFQGKKEKLPPKEYLVEGARAPRTYKAGDYIIQEKVEVLHDIMKDAKDNEYKKTEYYATYRKIRNLGDCHAKNVGVGKDGKLVIFDW